MFNDLAIELEYWQTQILFQRNKQQWKEYQIIVAIKMKIGNMTPVKIKTAIKSVYRFHFRTSIFVLSIFFRCGSYVLSLRFLS